MNQLVTDALELLQLPRAVTSTPLAGGCIHDVHRVDLDDGSSIVCKHAAGAQGGAMLESERESLDAIAATGTIRTPQVIGLTRLADAHLLFVEHLEPGTHGDWVAFGRSLGLLHCASVDSPWGFASDTWLGAFRQPNRQREDWHEFLRCARLEPQVRLAVDAGLLPKAISDMLQSVLDRLPLLVPEPALASLVHGDLWSGNCHVMASGQIAAIDPAVWVGDAWADIAMAQLFGGVPESMTAAWIEVVGDDEAAQERVAVHQLYHLLNHLNAFGGGYLASVEAVARTLG